MAGRATAAVGAEALEEGVPEIDLAISIRVFGLRNAVGVGKRKKVR
jgi:hypothetical protein